MYRMSFLDVQGSVVYEHHKNTLQFGSCSSRSWNLSTFLRGSLAKTKGHAISKVCAS